MPGRPIKGHSAVNLELPTELVERVREFARRDMRSIKSEFIRALELLLELDLPMELMKRVRDFALRDMRSIRTEFIRALELLLATHDSGTSASETTHGMEATVADTQRKTSRLSSARTSAEKRKGKTN